MSRWTRTRYKAVPIKASGHETAKLLWSRIRRRKSGGCVMKECVLTWGDLASRLKGRRPCRTAAAVGDSGRYEPYRKCARVWLSSDYAAAIEASKSRRPVEKRPKVPPSSRKVLSWI